MQSISALFTRSFRKALISSYGLLRLILPISLLVRLADYYGLLEYLSQFLEPLFIYIGLPGSVAVVFLTSIFLPLYAPIAIIVSMSMGLRELTILALMCQIAHNLPVESAIQAQTGTPFWRMFTLRIALALLVAFVLNRILPLDLGMPLFTQQASSSIDSLGELLIAWLKSSLGMSLLIISIIFLLQFFYALLIKYRLIDRLTKALAPVLRFFGLQQNTGFLFLIGYIVGLAYGGAMMIEQMQDGRVNKNEARDLNYHLAVSHSLIEDTLIFVVLGVSIWWILAVRLSLAWLLLWVKHGFTRMALRRKKI